MQVQTKWDEEIERLINDNAVDVPDSFSIRIEEIDLEDSTIRSTSRCILANALTRTYGGRWNVIPSAATNGSKTLTHNGRGTVTTFDSGRGAMCIGHTVKFWKANKC